MYKIAVVAPHPDDETFGCGGSILKHKKDGDEVHWIIVTTMTPEAGFSDKENKARAKEIDQINRFYEFQAVYPCGFPATKLDTLPVSKIVKAIKSIFQEIQPDVVYLPNKSDIHTDHQITFNAVASCVKWFRCPSIKRVLAYETLSETDFSLNLDRPFTPNYFVNIEKHLNRKIKAAAMYRTELAEFPFPRSIQALRSLAHLRGVASGYRAAEAFELLRERC